jgi:lipoate-protein ligase A
MHIISKLYRVVYLCLELNASNTCDGSWPASGQMSKILNILRVTKLPIFYQLKLEEALLRCTEKNWLIINDGAACPAVVLGISGKPHELIHVDQANEAEIQLIRRFTGGGTVVVDSNTVFVTMMFRTGSLPHVSPFPKPIMTFTGEVILHLLTAAYMY